MKAFARTFAHATAALALASAGGMAMSTEAGAHTTSTSVVVPHFPGAFHEIRNNFHTPAMCLQPTSLTDSAPIIQAPCNGSSIQGWVDNPVDSSNHYRFIGPSGECIFLNTDTPTTGSKLILGECQVPGGTTVSNAEWTSTHPLPNTDVALSTHVHFRENNFCIDEPNGTGAQVAIQVATCNGTTAQRWSVGFN
ncbi:RICIN domain-containing protein [Streptomyces sp. NPDC048291]|uniref:RICIN domain-containing protein n=1 Tax=Streptomyces sp. NPDC048291 TaxID=3365530 RepID=UPI0037194EE5